MVLSIIAAILSALTGPFTVLSYTTGKLISSGLLPPSLQSYRFAFMGSGQKSNMRLSASLQDFSRYSRLDPEEGDPHFVTDSRLSDVKPFHALQRESLGLSFSKEKSPPAASFTRKKWVRGLSSFLCLLLFLSSIFLCWRFFSSYKGTSQYYVVLDCGSTGTRVYVYESSIDQKKDHEGLPISLRSLPHKIQGRSISQSGRAYHRMETEPGFDKLVHNESGLRNAINPLLRWAEMQIPRHAHKSTSLFLYATAGVRRLPSADSDWLLDKAWSIFRNSSFLCQRDWVKIISGMEEAYYGWIALNYHMNMLGSTEKKLTFGSLDLGGSSLQVTFENEELKYVETGLNLSIGAVSHHLSAYSLSGYGLNDAFDKSVVHLLRRLPGGSKANMNDGKLELKHPCLQSGYREQYMCSHCAAFDGSPVNGGGSPAKVPGTAIELVGVPHWDECSELAKTTVNLSEWLTQNSAIDCDVQPCALKENYPRPRGQFYAMSGFFVVFRFFNLTSEATLDEVLQKGQEFCEKNWKVARKSVAPQPYIEQYCFRAPYIVSLLRDGLHISDKQVIIGSGSITWTLGVALLEAGNSMSHRMELHGLLHTKINPLVLVIMLLMSLVLFIFALSWVWNCIPRFMRRSYLPLFRHSSASAGSVLNIPSPFRFQRWSPISSSDVRVKTPLSPTIAGSEQHSFGMGHWFGGSNIEPTESFSYQSNVGVSHSYSSGSLGQMQFDNSLGWTPNRGQTRLQSRRSQSREDLNSSLAESHIVKV
ncbi:putative apyrase 7 [Acorus gramineus]|uniref:Apyrase 7 n=1 Tax=Acorus gramineus TaxID=55184 RepID=A0AAV9ARH7_ACOGR|nr:putative apyrase 7 [Acorus gramineus]